MRKTKLMAAHTMCLDALLALPKKGAFMQSFVAMLRDEITEEQHEANIIKLMTVKAKLGK